MIISPEPEEFRAAQALQAKCELRRIWLRQCQVSLEGSEDSLKGPFSLRFSHNSLANAIIDGLLRFEVRFQVRSYDSSEPPALLFDITCAFDLEYMLDDKTYQPSPESITAFKDGNALFNCWPYVREFVQSATARMGLNPPPLPFLRVVPKKKSSVEGHTTAEQPATATPTERSANLPTSTPTSQKD